MSMVKAIEDQARIADISDAAKRVMEILENEGGIFCDIEAVREVAKEILAVTDKYDGQR